jgi:hypothetical protein
VPIGRRRARCSFLEPTQRHFAHLAVLDISDVTI